MGFLKPFLKKVILTLIAIFVSIYLFIWGLFYLYIVNNKNGRSFFNYKINITAYSVYNKNDIKTIFIDDLKLYKNNIEYLSLKKIKIILMNSSYHFFNFYIKELEVDSVFITNIKITNSSKFLFYTIKKISPLFIIEKLIIKNIDILFKNKMKLLISEINANNVEVSNLIKINTGSLNCNVKITSIDNDSKLKSADKDKINHFLSKCQSTIIKIISNNFVDFCFKNFNCTLQVENLIDNFCETLELDNKQEFVIKSPKVIIAKNYYSFYTLQLENNKYLIFLNGEFSVFNYKETCLTFEIFDKDNSYSILKSYIKTNKSLNSYNLYLNLNYKDFLYNLMKNKIIRIHDDRLVLNATIYKNKINGCCSLFIDDKEVEVVFKFFREYLYDFWNYDLEIKSVDYVACSYINDFDVGSFGVDIYCSPKLKLLYSNNINEKWSLSGDLKISCINTFLTKNIENNIFISQDELVLLSKDHRNNIFNGITQKNKNFLLDSLNIEFNDDSILTFQDEKALKLDGSINFSGDLLNPISLISNGSVKCSNLQSIKRSTKESKDSRFYIPFSVVYAELNSQGNLIKSSTFRVEFKYKSKIGIRKNDVDTVSVFGNFSGLCRLQIKLRGNSSYVEIPFTTRRNLNLDFVYKNLNLDVLSIALDTLLFSISSGLRGIIFKENTEEQIRSVIEKFCPSADVNLFLVSIREFILELQVVGIDWGNAAVLFGFKNSIKEQDLRFLQNIYLDLYFFVADLTEIVISLLPITYSKIEVNFSFVF